MLVEQNLKSQQAFIMSFPGAQIVWAVEVVVGDSFHDVVGKDVVAAFEIGDGAGDFEDAFHGIAQFF